MAGKLQYTLGSNTKSMEFCDPTKPKTVVSLKLFGLNIHKNLSQKHILRTMFNLWFCASIDSDGFCIMQNMW